MTDVSERLTELRHAFQQSMGYWNSVCEQVFEASPEWFEAWLAYLAVPWRTGTLPPKVKELIYITLNASASHLHEPALRLHIANALQLGATAAEIVEVFQIISILGIHSMGLSMPILLEEARASGREIDVTQLSAQQVKAKAAFEASRGYWPATWDGILALTPRFFDAHERLGSVPREQGVLGQKVRELIYIALDASTTHLWASGVKTHIRAALQHGATVNEIVEVLELTSMLGTQSVTFGLPILMEEVVKFNQAADAANGGTDARS
jgi:alkylhydroperoxidase/carboxymuconolactone decarboxylase family protein YurZ